MRFREKISTQCNYDTSPSFRLVIVNLRRKPQTTLVLNWIVQNVRQREIGATVPVYRSNIAIGYLRAKWFRPA